MQRATQKASTRWFEYATAADFCNIFDKDMNSLYLLSLLLTGDHEKAEQCFVAGLDNAVKRNRVFREWARSWARRVIIQGALRVINPQPNLGTSRNWLQNDGDSMTRAERVEIAAVLSLPSFDRFIFVLTVLEDYSDHDCAILLGCGRREVLDARARALQRMGSVVESQLSQQHSHTEYPQLRATRTPALAFQTYAESA